MGVLPIRGQTRFLPKYVTMVRMRVPCWHYGAVALFRISLLPFFDVSRHFFWMLDDEKNKKEKKKKGFFFFNYSSSTFLLFVVRESIFAVGLIPKRHAA